MDLTADTQQALPEPPSFAEVYGAHAAFVWRSLRRLGVREADLPDVCQEAFLVVHKKLGAFQGTRLRPWLFAIAVRIASDYRKRAHNRHEVVTDQPPELTDRVAPGPSEALDHSRAAQLLDTLLESLDESKRSVFILYELEGMPMADIAEALQCPVQTAYSRLHAARAHVTSSVERWQLSGRQPR